MTFAMGGVPHAGPQHMCSHKNLYMNAHSSIIYNS